MSLSAHPTILHFLPFSFWRKNSVFGLRFFVILTNKKVLTTDKKCGIIRPGAHGPRARNFHYNTAHAICQAKSCENLHKLFFPILCNPSIDKSLRVCYIIIVPREQKDEVNKMTNYNIHSFIKTQLLTQLHIHRNIGCGTSGKECSKTTFPRTS